MGPTLHLITWHGLLLFIHFYCCTLAIEIAIGIEVEIVTNFMTIVRRFPRY